MPKWDAPVRDLLEEGYKPIIWCRYIATANYVAEVLKDKFEVRPRADERRKGTRTFETKKNNTTRVIAITGEQSEEEREIRLQELKDYPQRIMVATDCLSEGVNLQNHFSAVIHYDLPWNPNRLEQREGRVDRYGQTATKVKCIVLYHPRVFSFLTTTLDLVLTTGITEEPLYFRYRGLNKHSKSKSARINTGIKR